MINKHNERTERKHNWFAECVLGMANKLNPWVELESRRELALAVIVDDLDRCPKEKVMEMLKATHLLLEHPTAPMAVFLAVDPELIISAIAESLGKQNPVRIVEVGRFGVVATSL